MNNQPQVEMPVYLFTGFLEAGKTTVIRNTLSDPEFNAGEKTLLLLCEEGIEEYDPYDFPKGTVEIVRVEDVAELTPSFLKDLQAKHQMQRLMVEYNGMWTLDSFYNALPEGWFVYQELFFADSATFQSYNANMRSLVVDKLQSCEMVIFNRPENADRESFHKIVRGVSRKAMIAYEYEDGRVEYDEIEDPLPFDIEAPIIEIKDTDYAIWYRDMTEDFSKYVGKTIRFKGIVARDGKLPDTMFVIGRHIMVCCEADTAYRGVICRAKDRKTYRTRDWLVLTAKFVVDYNKLYGGKGPILEFISAEAATAPDPEIATFY